MYKFLTINFFRQQVKLLTFASNWCPKAIWGEKGIRCESGAVPATVSSKNRFSTIHCLGQTRWEGKKAEQVRRPARS